LVGRALGVEEAARSFHVFRVLQFHTRELSGEFGGSVRLLGMRGMGFAFAAVVGDVDRAWGQVCGI